MTGGPSQPPVTYRRCGYMWGDFRCQDEDGHDGEHDLVWDGDDDDE